MDDLFTLELPLDAKDDLADIRKAVTAIDGVAASGELSTRGLDPISIGLWVQLAGSMAGVATSIVGVLTKVYEHVQTRGIKNVKVNLGEGKPVIDVSGVTLQEFKAIMAQVDKMSRKA